MTLSDSMFLFEIAVEDVKSYIDCEEFKIRGRFADLFELNLKYPNEIVSPRKLKKKAIRGKAMVRRKKCVKDNPKNPKQGQIQSGQSILLVNKLHWIIANMKTYPMELSLWSKTHPEYKIGSTHIPWSKTFIDYLYNIDRKKVRPVLVEGIYNLFDEITSKRMAAIKINVKLTYFDYKISSEFKCVSESDQNTFMYNFFDSKTHILSTSKQPGMDIDEHGIVKTIYSSGKKKTYPCKLKKKRSINNKIKSSPNRTESSRGVPIQVPKNPVKTNHIDYLNNSKQISSKESTIDLKRKYNALDYLFDPSYENTNRVYCVGYMTVEKNKSDNAINIETSRTSLNVRESLSSEKSSERNNRFKFKKCRSECSVRNKTNESCPSVCSLDLPQEISHLVEVTKCKDIKCDSRPHRKLPDSPNDAILLDLTNLKKECCDEFNQKVEKVIGGVSAKLKYGEDPCFCTCECTFGFTKKTTYCGVCGGYEKAGDELARKPAHEIPIPCPIYHKLVDKNKLKTWSTSGSESKKKGDDNQKAISKAGSSQKASNPDKKIGLKEKKSVESEKDTKKSKKKKRDERFKFNYGYKAPQIGHSKCALPCTGTLGNVPKNMGWLWTAEDIPGMKFRPMWKPGATNKHVVRLLRIARNPGEVIAKKRRKDAGKKKRPLKRPLLIVHKKDGEFTVTMETMKTFSRPRALNQHPYEDKPVITYTIGRTEEENRERRKKKERAARRLERAQRMFIQSAFKDMCHEICLKTYQQALGILPDAEDPECKCYPALPTAERTNLDVSCSCSEESTSAGSDTDSDEWIIEFTPPNALFDPTYKGKKLFKADSGTQYTYLDYRVKLVDRFGNAVPRFFKGPDGKQQCSDLGGFWSPDHKWLEINIDGFVAPDGRWAPNNFLGPSGEQVDAETGKFQATNGKWLVVGVDGYIDCHGKWRFYPKPRSVATQRKRRGPGSGKKGGTGDIKDDKSVYKSEASWSCFGDASPKQLSRLGIIGHGQDKKLLLSTLQDMLARGVNVKVPQPSTVFHLSQKDRKGRKPNSSLKFSRSYLEDRTKCRHPIPSDKGITAVDAEGNKTYFRLKDFRNKRPKQRLAALADQGISLSSFHLPCFHSFINSEIMKKQQRDRLMKFAGKSTATQVSFKY